MSVNPPDQQSIIAPVFGPKDAPARSPVVGDDKKHEVEHLEISPTTVDKQGTPYDPHKNVGAAIIEQKHVGPKPGHLTS